MHLDFDVHFCVYGSWTFNVFSWSEFSPESLSEGSALLKLENNNIVEISFYKIGNWDIVVKWGNFIKEMQIMAK